MAIVVTNITGIFLNRVIGSVLIWLRITQIKPSSESEGTHLGNPGPEVSFGLNEYPRRTNTMSSKTESKPNEGPLSPVEFINQFSAGALSEPVVLAGMVKAADAGAGLTFALGSNDGYWIKIPSSIVEQVEHVVTRRLGNTDVAMVKLTLKQNPSIPSDELAAALSELLKCALHYIRFLARGIPQRVSQGSQGSQGCQGCGQTSPRYPQCHWDPNACYWPDFQCLCYENGRWYCAATSVC